MLEGEPRGARVETIGEASVVVMEGMPGQSTAVAFAVGQCGQARRMHVLRHGVRGRRGTVVSVNV